MIDFGPWVKNSQHPPPATTPPQDEVDGVISKLADRFQKKVVILAQTAVTLNGHRRLVIRHTPVEEFLNEHKRVYVYSHGSKNVDTDTNLSNHGQTDKFSPQQVKADKEQSTVEIFTDKTSTAQQDNRHSDQLPDMQGTVSRTEQAAEIAKWFADHPEAFGKYHLAAWNCEHFATFCQTTTLTPQDLSKALEHFEGSLPNAYLRKNANAVSRQAQKIVRRNVLKQLSGVSSKPPSCR